MSDVSEIGQEGVGPLGGEAAIDVGRLLERAARASSRRPRSLSLFAEIVERHGEIGPEGVGPFGGEAAVDVDRLLRGGEGVLAPAEFAQASCRDC